MKIKPVFPIQHALCQFYFKARRVIHYIKFQDITIVHFQITTTLIFYIRIPKFQ